MAGTTMRMMTPPLRVRGALLPVLVLLACTARQCLLEGVSAASFEPSFWEFTVQDAGGKDVSLSTFKDTSKAILLVNVASECGYTDQNYRELQVLYEKYHEHGLEILAFPCNQFGGQEPKEEPAILEFVREQYHVTFPVLSKIEVNGKEAHPLFKYLKAKLHGFVSNAIKWNFTKFLVVNGVPTKRFGTTTSPLQMEDDIARALGLPAPSDHHGQEL